MLITYTEKQQTYERSKLYHTVMHVVRQHVATDVKNLSLLCQQSFT